MLERFRAKVPKWNRSQEEKSLVVPERTDTVDTRVFKSKQDETHVNVGPLPLEMCLEIINHLCNDKHALSSCALVSHTWNAASRYHQFYSVKLSHADEPEKWDALFGKAPHLSVLVHNLDVSVNQYFAEFKPSETNPFPNVKHALLRFYRWEDFHPQAKQWIWVVTRRLTSLNIAGNPDIDVQSLLRLIEDSPHLAELTLSVCLLDSRIYRYTSQVICRPTKLIWICDRESEATWLALEGARFGVRDLALISVPPYHLTAVAKYLKELGSGLESFKFTYKPRTITIERFENIGLQHSTCLSSISLQLGPTATQTIEILSQIVSTLQLMQFTIDPEGVFNRLSPQVPELERYLISGRCRAFNLQTTTVQFVIDASHSLATFTRTSTYIKLYFKEIYALGNLECIFSKPVP